MSAPTPYSRTWNPFKDAFWQDSFYELGKLFKSRGKGTPQNRTPGYQVVMQQAKDNLPGTKDWWQQQAAEQPHYEYFDPHNPREGVYGNRYWYKGGQEKWSESWWKNFEWGLAGANRPSQNGSFTFVDITTGQPVLDMEVPEAIRERQIASAGKRVMPVDPRGIEPTTGGYRPSATFGVRNPRGESNAAPYDPIAARAEQMIRDMSGARRSHAAAIPQAPQYQFVSEPVLVPLSQPSPMPQAPQYQRSLEPTVQFPGEAPVPLNPRARPSVSVPAGGPIRRRRGARAVAQPEPFDYVSYLSNLASLRYNF